MKRNWVLILLTASLFTVVSLLTLHLHYGGIREVLFQFQQHQLSYAKHLSNQIQFFIQARSRGLKALSSFASIRSKNVRQLKADIETYASEIGKVYVKKISLYNESGIALYSTDPAMIGENKKEDVFFVWAQRPKNRDKTLLSPTIPESQALTFTLATPVYREVSDSGRPENKWRFAGVLTFTLDMKEFLVNQLGAVDPKMSLNQIWIMDKDGTLLFQPDHPEMVFRNIFQREGDCRSCHFSFGYAEEILTGKQGTFDYTIRNHPKKIAAFVSMEFEDAAWVVVVNTSYDRITGFIRESLREHLILIGIVVVALAIGSGLLLRKERMKIRAEEEAVRWQEKMAERRRGEEALELERNKLKGILDSMNDGVYIVNEQYDIVYTNPVIEKNLGPFKGQKCYEYLHDLPAVCSWCKAKEVSDGETVRWEWHSLKTGKTYDIYDIPYKGPDGTLCKLQFARDISKRKQAEEALEKSEKQLRSLSSQLLTAQETERKRISRELHDELGQSLTVLKLRLNFIEKNLLKDQTELRKECDIGVNNLNRVIENIRRLSRDLSPTILEDFGLSAALRWLVNNFAKNYNIRVNLNMTDIDYALPRISHVAVYRIVQETLTNIGKHARANNVSITINEDGDNVLFSIEDDGVGFDSKITAFNKSDESGLGLATMKGRAEMAGGTLDIWTEEGRGTRIRVNFPIQRGET